MPKRPHPQPKILIVEDDQPTRVYFAEALSGAGYRMVQAGDGVEGLAVAELEKPALIILDIDMPKANGWQTLEALRRSGYSDPIIMLTGQTQIEDRVRGLSGGADDYLSKPCDRRELIARVHAVLRRSQPAVSAVTKLCFGATTVDLANRTATCAGAAVPLTRTEYAMLEVFARNPGQLVTRDVMLDLVWGYARQSNTRTVDTHIWRLRQKINDSTRIPQWIQTVPAGGGYRMVSDHIS